MLIHLAQLCHEAGNQYQNKCFPLAIGYIAAYLKKIFTSDVQVELFKSPSDFCSALETSEPNIVMLSNYMWNEALTLVFARKIKERYPDALIVLGGPNISLDAVERERFMRENPALDILVQGDGEFIAENLVRAHLLTRDVEDTKRVGFPRPVP